MKRKIILINLKVGEKMKFNNHVKNQYNNLAISDKLAKTDPFF